MGSARILIVDDELVMRESLSGWLKRDGYEVKTVASGEDALDTLEMLRFDILLVDIKLEGMSGLELLKQVKERNPNTAIIMITAYGSISTAIEAMKTGASDYLLKPFDPAELGMIIEKILKYQAQQRENIFFKEQNKERTRFENMIGQSKSMQSIFTMIQNVAPTNSTVLITGETGTGKGLAAKAIHANSPRCAGPFVAVNCGAIPEHLMETELFGYQKGAFTDAKENKKGRLELSHGGTLFLDEIGEISMRMQIDLLRILEDGVFYRVGGTQAIETDFRVIAATNSNLEESIKQRKFREDLYYRLNVIAFRMPSLRERKEDIPILAEYFLHLFAQEIKRPIEQISREALDEMMLYEWPGNIRELENAIERAVVVCKGSMISVQDLPIFRTEHAPIASGNTLKEIEREHIVHILEQNHWNMTHCAKILGIDRSTLYSKMKRHRIQKSLYEAQSSRP